MQGMAGAAGLQDTFAQREILTTPSGQVTGTSAGADRELQEPLHANKPGGASLWVSWVAPTNGIVTFRTAGSGFDTLLAAYYFKPSDPQTLDQLEEAASNDDDPLAAPASLMQFAARAGQRFEIAVDGYRGAAGSVVLAWQFIDLATEPPIVVGLPSDHALRLGDSLTLSASFDVAPDARLQWRFNDESFGAEGPTLFIPSLQSTNVGRYSLRIRIDDVRFETRAVEIQVNSEGATNALARDKVFDSIESRLSDDPPPGGGGGGGGGLGGLALAAAGPLAGGLVTRGYDGAQIFNTTYATPDPNEPRHCGVTGGASYWFDYTAPATGTLIVDTLGSGYDTVLAGYGLQLPVIGYESLVALTCDNDSLAPHGADRISLPVTAGRQYLIAVDGVDGARGLARLNYHLLTTTNTGPASFTNAAGIYNGVFIHPVGMATESTGWLAVNLRSSGAFSGVLRQADRRLSFSGRFDPDGRTRLQVPRAGPNRLALELIVDFSSGNSLTSRLAGLSWTVEATLAGAGDFVRDAALASLVGRYTLLLPGALEPGAGPMGDGAATVGLNKSGLLAVAGVLADGTKFSQKVPASRRGGWPLFATLNRGRSLVAGELQLRPDPDPGHDIAGSVHWLRLAGSAPQILTNGFHLVSAAAGSAFVNPGAGRVLDLNSAALTLINDVGAVLASNVVRFGSSGRITNQGPARLTLSVVPSSGWLRGLIDVSGSVRPVAMSGVVLQRQHVGGGFFVRSNAVGRVQLEPWP